MSLASIIYLKKPTIVTLFIYMEYHTSKTLSNLGSSQKLEEEETSKITLWCVCMHILFIIFLYQLSHRVPTKAKVNTVPSYLAEGYFSSTNYNKGKLGGFQNFKVLIDEFISSPFKVRTHVSTFLHNLHVGTLKA